MGVKALVSSVPDKLLSMLCLVACLCRDLSVDSRHKAYSPLDGDSQDPVGCCEAVAGVTSV